MRIEGNTLKFKFGTIVLFANCCEQVVTGVVFAMLLLHSFTMSQEQSGSSTAGLTDINSWTKGI